MVIAITAAAALGFLGSAWTPTQDDEEWARDVRLALDATGLSDKEIAALLGVPKSQLSNMLALRAHWSGWRERQLPPSYHLALAKIRMARFRAHVIDNPDMWELIITVKHMARMYLETNALKTGTEG